MEHETEVDQYEGIDLISAYHLRNIRMSLSALATDTIILKVKGTGMILTQAEIGIKAVIKLLREQKAEKG